MGTQTLLCLCMLSCVLVYSDSATPSFRCDYQYHPAVEGWLKYHRVPAAWPEARLRCHLEGGTLASPINKDFTSTLSSFGGRPVFTGIHATFSKGDFYTIEGVPLWKLQHEWACNEPDNAGGSEQCTVLYADGRLADVPCWDHFPYVCYKQYDQRMLLNECGTVDHEYKLNRRTGSCYKFHQVRRNWTRAFMTCAAEGAHLAIINSDAEAKYLTTLFPPEGGTLELDLAHLGFQDYGERGVWRTIHGETIQNTTYEVWAGPDNAPPGEYCGSMFRNGKLNDVWCDRRFYFICEKDPKSLLCDDDLYQIHALQN
ncbi:uncharacterized protein LOC119692904 isoform X2 [Plutella xylostella]|uniref:uncharacterized protein LOC119692904 isoform X2 n=1 Tax=Plutella xylostella TaxID=51655 RepID=UPI0020330871|nr:uncharacterized protein LOC119692904 isoform X2 [Plutella xylostella]